MLSLLQSRVGTQCSDIPAESAFRSPRGLSVKEEVLPFSTTLKSACFGQSFLTLYLLENKIQLNHAAVL